MSNEKRWLCRERVDADTTCLNGVAKTKVWHELVWGCWEAAKEHKNGQYTPARIVGESYHELHGPTSGASIQSFAEDLNMRGVPPSKVDFKQSKKPKNDPNQMSLLLMMSPNFKEKK